MNYFVDAFKKYAVFTGRARRSELWWFLLINFIINGILTWVVAPLIGTGIIGTIYSLAIMLPLIGLWIRRMHDINKCGWFMLIPIYNIILGATAGDDGENKYGANPKA